MSVSAGLGAGMFLFWIFMSLIFSGIGLIIGYFVIRTAVKNAIRDSEIDIRIAIKRGIIEAYKENDNLNKSKDGL